MMTLAPTEEAVRYALEIMQEHKAKLLRNLGDENAASNLANIGEMVAWCKSTLNMMEEDNVRK